MRVHWTQPQAAVGAGQARQAGEKLEQAGYALEEYKGAFFGLGSKSWTRVDAEKACRALAEGKQIRAVKGDRAIELHSQEDALELAAARAQGGRESLPSPVLMGALMTLEKAGTLRCYHGSEHIECTAYEAYNALTGDRNHSYHGVTFHKGKAELKLQAESDARDLAYLAGFGDGQGVSPDAALLSQLVKDQFISDPFELLAAGKGPALLDATAEIDIELGKVSLDQLREQRADYQTLLKATGRATLARATLSFVRANARRVPVADQAKALARLPGDDSARGSALRGILDSLQPTDDFQAVTDMVVLGFSLGKKQSESLQAYRYKETHPERAGVYQWAWERHPDPAAVAEKLPAEKLETLSSLGAVHDAQAVPLALEMLARGRFDEDAARVQKLPPSREIVAHYRVLADHVKPEEDELYLRFLSTRPPTAQVAELWEKARGNPAAVPVAEALARHLDQPLEVRLELGQHPEAADLAAALKELGAERQLHWTRRLLAEATPELPAEQLVPLALQARGSDLSYEHLRELGERGEAYLALLAHNGDPEASYRLASGLSSVHPFRNAQRELEALQWPARAAISLMQVALQRGRLEEDQLLLSRFDPASASEVYTFMLDHVAEKDRWDFTHLARQLPKEHLAEAWAAVSLDPEHTEERGDALLALRAMLPKEPLETITGLTRALPVGSDPFRRIQALKALQEKMEPEELLPSVRQVLSSRSPELAGRLVGLGAPLAQALEMTRWMTRDTFPGAELPEETRGDLLGELAGLRQGNLSAALEDYLFLAHRVPDPQALPGAVKFLAHLREDGFDARDARLACADLQERESAEPYADVFSEVAGRTRSYAAAKPAWDALQRLSPAEAQARLQAVDRPWGLPSEQVGRLIAGQATAPLSPAGIEVLAGLLERRNAVEWSAAPGWSQVDRGWSTTQAGVLKSGAFRPDPRNEGILHLSLKGAAEVSLWEPGADKAAVTLFQGTADEWTQLRFSLMDYRGKPLQLQIAATGPAEVKDLRMEETRTGELLRITPEDFERATGTASLTLQTSKAWRVPDHNPRWSMSASHNIPSGAYIHLDVWDNGDWRTLKSLKGPNDVVQHDAVDLSAYAGKPVVFRYHINAAGSNGTASLGWVNQALVESRPGLADRQLELVGRGPVRPETADECLSLAFDPELDQTARENTLQALKILSREGDVLEGALAALPILRDQLDQPDLVDRARALSALLGEDDPRAAYELVCSERRPGESFEALARVLAGRPPEQFRRIRQLAHCEGAEAADARIADFLGAVSQDPEAVWKLVSEPVRSETLPDRLSGFQQLLAATGDLDEATRLYRLATSRLDPNEPLPRALQATAELRAALADPGVTVEVLGKLHAHQSEGVLEGRSLVPMVRFLVNEAILTPAGLEAALQRMPDELIRQQGIEERDKHVLVGGVRIHKR